MELTWIIYKHEAFPRNHSFSHNFILHSQNNYK